MMLQSNLTYCSLSLVTVVVIINVLWSMRLFHLSRCSFITVTVENASQTVKHTLKLSGPMTKEDNVTVSALKLNNTKTTLSFKDMNSKMPRADNRRMFNLYDFALVGATYAQASRSSLVCLATQTSIERMHPLASVAKQWKGPISVAVFVAGNEEFHILQMYTTYLRLCFNFIESNVTFHIATPISNQSHFKNNKPSNLLSKFDCQYPEKTLNMLLSLRSVETIRWRLKHEYPQNLMRNLARKGCPNGYVFLTDIDIIPSRNTFTMLNTFLRSQTCRGLCAYVIPTFEIDERVKFPNTKSELIRVYKKGLARPFHEKVFIYNQYATNFSSWISSTSEEIIQISHNVTNFEFLYEPFYVAFDNVPMHDERFIGYGFTRNSQVYEMHVAGYKFMVLTPVFTCHWGLQQKKTRPAWREHQNNINRKRFETFKMEVHSRYKKG